MKKLALLFVFTLITITSVFSQSKYIGKVVDQKGRPLSEVKVIINGDIISTTNNRGIFESNLFSAPVTVKAEKHGYKLQEWGVRAQNKQIQLLMWPSKSLLTGIVFDETNTPKSNSSIEIKGINKGAPEYTNFEGEFSILLSDKQELTPSNLISVDGVEVDPKNVSYTSSNNSLVIRFSGKGKKSQTSNLKQQPKKVVSEVNPVLIVVVYDGDESPAQQMTVNVDKNLYQTNDEGRFEIPSDDVSKSEFGIEGHKITKMTYDYRGNFMYLYIKDQNEIDKEEETFDEMGDDYEQDFNIILNKLESEKQLLSEKSLELRTEIEKIATRLGDEKINEEQRKSYEAYLNRLETALIENEVAYEDAQFKTKQVLEKMKRIIVSKDSVTSATQVQLETVEKEKIEEEAEFRKQIAIFSVITLILVVIVISMYILFKRINKQKQEIEAAHKDLKVATENIEQAHAEMQVVRDIGKKVTSKLDLEELTRTLQIHAEDLLDASVFGVGILNQTEKIFEFRNNLRKGEVTPPYFEDLNDESKLSVWAIKNYKEVIINNYEEEYNGYIRNHELEPSDIYPASVIYLPLIYENEPVGVLHLQSDQLNAYKNINVDALRTLGSYISIAVANTFAYDEIKYQNQKITDSIRYAETIQQAILPSREHLSKTLDNHFVWYQPKDIVSGDIFWYSHAAAANSEPERKFIVALDATGHGVPGAFMTMIGNTLLNEIINIEKTKDPAEILTVMDKRVKIALKQDQKANTDGMDVCLVIIEKTNEQNQQIKFSGAKRPLFLLPNNSDEIEIISGDLKSVGGFHKNAKSFTSQTIKINTGDKIYLFTDGVIHQNNSERKKLGTTQFKQIIESNASANMHAQKIALQEAFSLHKGGEEQRDDITVIGIEL